MRVITIVAIHVAVFASLAFHQAASQKQIERPTDTFLLAEYSFDDNGQASTQGWVLHDQSYRSSGGGANRTAAIDTFFHVASAIELNGGQFGSLTPLEGDKSMWCGTTPGALLETCDWATLPGYGDGWDQRFESKLFAVNGDVLLSYKIRWDSEHGLFDFTTVEYLGAGSSAWTSVQDGGRTLYESKGESTEQRSIPAVDHGGTLKIRFRFQSDGAFSDQDGEYASDGAVLIDSLTVSDSSGILSFQDFESEPDGAHATNDGHWSVRLGAKFGKYGALFSGSQVLQEDPGFVNETHLWGFFDSSPDSYACGGHPEQPAVPLPRFGGVDDPHDLYLDNEIWSPPIDWATDVDGISIPASADSAYLEFDVYRDLPHDHEVSYSWAVRSLGDGCAQEWQSSGPLFGDQKAWYRHVEQIAHLVAPNASQVQISLKVAVSVGSSECHSHAPLFDNVRLIRTKPTDVPVLLGHFDAIFDGAAVLLDGSLSTGSDAWDLRITGRRHGLEWEVPLRIEDGHRFSGVDNSEHLSEEGNLTYRLYVRDAFNRWSLLAERTLRVEAPSMRVRLFGAAPNPFNPRTEISFSAPRGRRVQVLAYDVRGRLVDSLFDGVASGQRQVLVWEPNDLGSGVYFIKAWSLGTSDTKRVVLVK